MCGYTVFIHKNNINISMDEFSKINDLISHRGPDFGKVEEFIFSDINIKMGHRRLSIIDLSKNGNQPMHSSDDRFVIVYNGELYNYNELKSLCEKLNTKLNWKSTSDTEIIIELFNISF